MNQSMVLLLAVACGLLTTAGQVILKVAVSEPSLVSLLGNGQVGLFLWRSLGTPMVLLGLVVYGLSAVLWLLVLARADVSYAFPLVSLGFVFTAVYAHFALHEPLAGLRIAGIALIMAGVVCVSRS